MSSEALARPVDRLAAVIVDVFVLLVPIFILLSAPLKRWMTASFILGEEPDFILMIVSMTVLGVVQLVAYQALMHRYFGATVGKIIFDLRVQPVFWGQKMTLSNHVLRALVWIAEVLLIGLPFLAVFSNSKRRTLHDRVCDTVVVVRTNSSVGPPAIWERGLVRAFFAVCIILTGVIAGSECHHLFQRFKSEKSLALGGGRDAGCEAVSASVAQTAAVNSAGGSANTASAKTPSVHSRLDLAMSLYAAGAVDRECLESEIEHELSMQVPVGPVTYLAQAFVNADDADISNSYLDQVCEESPSSVECTMSQVVSKWSEEDWSTVTQLLHDGKKGSGYLEVWGVRHFMKQGNYQQALVFLDSLSQHHELADFSLVQRVKALYDANLEDQATAALAQALPVVNHEDSAELSSWMCAQQLQNGCAALDNLACREVRSTQGSDHEIDFEKPSEALSQVMALECHENHNLDYLSFSESVKDEDWQNFFRANLKQQKNDRPAAFSLFADVVRSTKGSDLLRVEALRRMTQMAEPKQYAALYDLWQAIEPVDAWGKAGNILFNRLAQKDQAPWALKVARELLTAEALSAQSQAVLSHMGTDTEPSQRLPASVPGDKLGHARARAHQ